MRQRLWDRTLNFGCARSRFQRSIEDFLAKLSPSTSFISSGTAYRAGLAGCAPRRRSGPSSRCRSEEHTSELQSRSDLVCRLLLEKKKKDSSKTLPTPNSIFTFLISPCHVYASSTFDLH